MLENSGPTNNALVMGFLLSSDAETFVNMHRLSTLVYIPTELPFCIPPLLVGWVGGGCCPVNQTLSFFCSLCNRDPLLTVPVSITWWLFPGIPTRHSRHFGSFLKATRMFYYVPVVFFFFFFFFLKFPLHLSVTLKEDFKKKNCSKIYSTSRKVAGAHTSNLSYCLKLRGTARRDNRSFFWVDYLVVFTVSGEPIK